MAFFFEFCRATDFIDIETTDLDRWGPKPGRGRWSFAVLLWHDYQ